MCKLCMFLIKSNPFNSSSPPRPPLITQLVISYLHAIWYTTQIERANIHNMCRKGRFLHLRYEYALAGNTFQICILKVRLFILTSLLLEMLLRAPPCLTAWSWYSDWIYNTHLRKSGDSAKTVSKPWTEKEATTLAGGSREVLGQRKIPFTAFFLSPFSIFFPFSLLTLSSLWNWRTPLKNWHLLEKVPLLELNLKTTGFVSEIKIGNQSSRERREPSSAFLSPFFSSFFVSAFLSGKWVRPKKIKLLPEI